MLKQTVAPLSIVATVLAITGFALTYVTGNALSVVLAIMAWIYYFGTALLIVFSALLGEGIRERLVSGAVGVGVVVIIVLQSHGFTDFIPAFGGLQLIGAIFFVVVAIVAGIASVESYRDNHKNCPECLNTLNARVRICQHCGYRWEPPLEGKDRPHQYWRPRGAGQ